MSKLTEKYLVSDEEGPIRAFYNLKEAEQFAGDRGTITVVRERWYDTPEPSYDDLKASVGEALW